jgi:hypothetical protein
MGLIETVVTTCPYCGSSIELVIDCSIRSQEFIEDCEVCCRPLQVRAFADGDGEVGVDLRQEGE